MTAETEAPTPRPACPVCHRPDPHGHSWACCAGCVADVDAMLGEILDLKAQACDPENLARGRSGDTGPIGAHRDPPPPLNMAVLEIGLGEDALGVLESWERWWREEFPELAPYGEASEHRLIVAHRHERATDVTLSGVVTFLRARWPLAASLVEPPPEEFAAEVRALWVKARRALGRHEPPPWTVPCPSIHPDTGAPCGKRLPVEDYGAGLRLHCNSCGADWTTDRLLLVAKADGRAVWVDAETAADRLGTTRRGLAIKVRAGLVRKHGDRYDITTTDTSKIDAV